jgi:hypothetical protein
MKKKVIRLFQEGMPETLIEVPAEEDYEMVNLGDGRIGYVLTEKQQTLSPTKE